MTDPKFCFRSNVQYPNRLRLLRFHDAPELLHIIIIIIAEYDMIISPLGEGNKTHVGGYPRCGILARVQTQRLPIGPGTSAELHIVDVLDLPHPFTLNPTRRAGGAALPKFDAPKRGYAQRGVDQQRRLVICELLSERERERE